VMGTIGKNFVGTKHGPSAVSCLQLGAYSFFP